MKKQKSFRPIQSTGWKSKSVYNGRSALDKLYDGNWEKYRLKFLRHNPTCYSCGSKALVVDHIQPHKGDEKLFKKLDNHLPLCHKCHNTITALFDKNYIKGNTIEPKLKWIAQNRINYQCDVRVKVLSEYGP